MTFAVDQARNQAVIGSCFLAEHDSSKRSFRASSWISENEDEARVQGFFAAASERLVKCNDPAAKLSEPTFISHAMACEQMQLTTDVAPSTPLPSLPRNTAERHEANDPRSVIPSLCLSIGSPKPHPVNINEKLSVDDLSCHPKPFTCPLAVPSPSPLSPNVSKPFNALQLDSQIQHSELYGGKLPSLLRSNQSEYCEKPHYNHLSLGSYNGGETARQKNLCMSRFSFIEALTSENADDLQPSKLENANNGGIRNSSSPVQGRSNVFDLECEDSVRSFKRSYCSSASTGTTDCISSQGSSLALLGHNTESSSFVQAAEPIVTTLSFSQVLPTSISEASPVKIKQDWDLCKYVPDFFAQKKASLKLDTPSQHSINGWAHPEKRCKLLFSGNAAMSSFGKCSANPFTQTEYVVKHQDSQHRCGLESFDAQIKCDEENLVDADLLSVKSEDKQGGFMEANCITETSSSLLATLMGSPPGSHLVNINSTENSLPKAEKMKSIKFIKQQGMNQTAAEGGESTPVSIVKGPVVVDGDWGKFLALSATPLPVGQSTTETSSDILLPFQRRFRQLQTFLKQCDESDQTYCLEALRVLSAAERSGRAVALETRAVNLSIEEGKELKRMKMLNVLSKYADTSITPQGPKLPAPGMTMLQVKQET